MNEALKQARRTQINQNKNEALGNLWLVVYYLQRHPSRWPFEGLLSRSQGLAAAIEFAQNAGLEVESDDPNFLSQVAQEIIRQMAQEERVVAPNVPVNIAEMVDRLDAHLAQEALRKERISLYTEKAKELFSQHQQAIQQQLEVEQPILAENPRVAKEVTEEITRELIEQVPPTATETAFEISTPKEEYQETVAQALNEQLKKAGLPPLETERARKVADRSRPSAAAIATNRHLFPTAPSRPEPATKPPAELPPLPEEVVKKLAAQVEGTAFRPIIFRPPRPVVAVLQAAADNLTDEWQIMIKQRIFSEDIQASIKAFKEAGLDPNHPVIKQLEIADEKIRVVQKVTLPNGQEADHPLVKRLKRACNSDKKLGRWQERLSAIRTFLPRSSPAPKDTPWRQFLRRVGQTTGFYRQVRLGPTKTVLRPVIGPLFRNAFSRIAIAFKKTQLGKAVTGGIKNIATRIAVRLGAKEAAKKAVKVVAKVAKVSASKLIAKGLAKIGLAIIPEPIISKALAIFLIVKNFIWGLFKNFFLRIKNFFADFLPRQAKYATRTASDQITNGLALTAAIAGSFFVILATGTLIATGPLTLLVGGSIALPAVLALFQDQSENNAFLQEGLGEKIDEDIIGETIPARPPEEAGHLAEAVIWTLNECGFGRVTPTTWKSREGEIGVEECLANSNLSGKQIIINQFEFSVYQVGPALQCVGFVRGVMGALGLDPGGGRHAGQFLNPPPPNGYSVSTELSLAQVGDLVVMRGNTYGHIAIVVHRDGPRIRVAQAFGETGGIRITQLNAALFDGFLRAHTP